MEHARKMVLIPRDSLERIGQLQRLQTESVQTPGIASSRLDVEMSKILNGTDDDREKWAKYQQVLSRYLQLKNTERPAIPQPKKEEDETDTAAVASDNSMLDRSILLTVPNKFRSKAKNLVSRLRNAGNVTWDTRGDVLIDGAPIPGANIVDLVNAAMRERAQETRRIPSVTVSSP